WGARDGGRDGEDQEADQATEGEPDKRNQILGRQPLMSVHDQPEDGPHDTTEAQGEHHAKDQNDHVQHLRPPSGGKACGWALTRALLMTGGVGCVSLCAGAYACRAPASGAARTMPRWERLRGRLRHGSPASASVLPLTERWTARRGAPGEEAAQRITELEQQLAELRVQRAKKQSA